jgi:Parvulin-like peptidyl-prolyl isomerase
MLSLVLSLACCSALSIDQSLYYDYGQGTAAEVGMGKVGVDQVFELWGPVWYETLTKVRNGKMSVQAGDDQLQKEWAFALRALIKEELFYQEAEREHNTMINNYAEMIFRSQGDGYVKPRNQIASEVRTMMRQDMDKSFREITNELIKESGGVIKLRKVLEGRGLSYRDWQERLKKKAFTQTYLSMILNPRAPAPGPKAVQEYYASHSDEFVVPGTVRFRHIFFSKDSRGGEEAAREAVSDVWGMLMDEEIDFETAAAQFSDDPVSAARGGLETEDVAADPEREAWLGDIRAALREETPNQLAPILESPFGFHLAMLLSIGADSKIPFKEVRKSIERKLANAVFQAESDKYFTVVRKNTPITIMAPNFPPELSCQAQQVRPSDVPSFYKLGEVGLPGLY